LRSPLLRENGSMKSDHDIRQDVEHELRWDPDIDATDIAVAVRDGVVSLGGYVRSYSQKWEADRDAMRVSGVRGLANDIEVRLPSVDQRPDPEIARDAATALKLQLPYWSDHIAPDVQNGRITLKGEAQWYFQRERAEDAVRHVRGAKGVTNLIAIKPHVSAADVKARIEQALKRNAEIDANHITVEAEGGKVILRGKVRSWAERQQAEHAAWRAPGVTSVEDRINIGA
jgi:osmotically-inducible protein OsmY